MRDAPKDGSTAPPELPMQALRRGRNVRRCGIAALLIFVALGVVGVLGVTNATASSRGEDVELEVHYARVARTGLTAPISIVVRADRGFATPPRVRINREYLGIFSTFELEPRPLRSLSQGEGVVWEFAPPVGSTLAIDIATRVDPSAQRGAAGEVAVLDGDRPLVQVSLRTTLMP